MLGRCFCTHVCTLAVCLHHGAVYTVHLPPCHLFVYCVWYGVMYGDMRYGDMHGVAYNILVFWQPVALLLLVCVNLAPGTSLVTFDRCPSRVRGMTCYILVRLPFYPHLFVFWACYGAVVLPMQVGLQCMVSYLRKGFLRPSPLWSGPSLYQLPGPSGAT